MAHNLALASNGQRAMYSLKVGAWHSLGTVVNQPLNTPDLRIAAGMDWEPESGPIFDARGNRIMSHKAIMRTDNHKVLGVVGDKYGIVQNSYMFDLLARAAGASEMVVETAGTLGLGETVWLMASIPSMTFGKGDDMNKAFLLFKNSHDGSGKFVAQPTMVRVVCENTLRMAIGADAKGRVSKPGTVSEGYAIRHTSGIVKALAKVADAFAQTRRDFQQTEADFQALSAKRLTTEDWKAMIGCAWPKPVAEASALAPEGGSVLDAMLADMGSKHAAASERSRAESIAKVRMDRLEEILASGTCRTRGTEGTLWSGLQAITEYCDHDSRTRVTEGTTEASQRFESSMFGGTADQTKARAYEGAMQLARA